MLHKWPAHAAKIFSKISCFALDIPFSGWYNELKKSRYGELKGVAKMESLGELRQAGQKYTFAVDGTQIFVNGQPATYVTNKRGIPVITFGDTTIENIGVMKFRLEKNGVLPKAMPKVAASKNTGFTTYDNVFETWDMSPSEKREFERRR
jgi:hypothetical protein